MQEQLSLNVALRDAYCFDTFYVHKQNETLINELSSLYSSPQETTQHFIWGQSLSGKSHLLNAVCSSFDTPVQYIPLKDVAHYGPDLLIGLEESRLLAIDDVGTVIGDRNWEEALFNLINKMREKQHSLLFSATENPRFLECELQDLASRLVWGGSYQLTRLSDSNAVNALILRAEYRGMTIPDDVIQFLIKRIPRDMGALLDALDILDKKSLQSKALITIPFVKRVLDI